MGRYLPPLRKLAVVRLLLGGMSARKVARECDVSREAVDRIAAQLRGGDLDVALGLQRVRWVGLRTELGRKVSHTELLAALIRKTAVKITDENGKSRVFE